MKENGRTCIALLSILFLTNFLIIFHVTYKNHVSLLEEGGIVENITAFSVLFSGTLLFFDSLNKCGIERRITQIFSTTCLVIFLREVDVEDLDLPHLLIFAGSGIGRNIIFCSIYFILLSIISLKFRSIISVKFFTSIIKSPISIMVLAGCALFMMGAIFEEFHNELGEEIMEMNGGMLIMLAALIHLKLPIYTSAKPQN